MRPAMVAALAILLTLGPATGTALAQSKPPEPGDRLREELDRSLDRLLLALRALLAAIPHYGMPEVSENGDIIIRRINPSAPPARRKPAPPGDVERIDS